jgi:hypothetical protein
MPKVCPSPVESENYCFYENYIFEHAEKKDRNSRKCPKMLKFDINLM